MRVRNNGVRPANAGGKLEHAKFAPKNDNSKFDQMVKNQGGKLEQAKSAPEKCKEFLVEQVAGKSRQPAILAKTQIRGYE